MIPECTADLMFKGWLINLLCRKQHHQNNSCGDHPLPMFSSAQTQDICDYAIVACDKGESFINHETFTPTKTSHSYS